MSEQIQNPHDRFFKSMMSDNEIAIAFLEEFLPGEIRDHLVISKLEQTNSSYLTSELGEYFADVVFRIPIKSLDKKENNCQISVLLEHKSYVDEHTDFQILTYISHAYLQQVRNKEQLQLIIPVLYYQGKDKWVVKPIRSFFSDTPIEFQKYIPDFEKIFINLFDLTESDIQKLENELIRSALSVQYYRHQPEKLIEVIIKISGTLQKFSNRNYTKSLIVYTFNALRDK